MNITLDLLDHPNVIAFLKVIRFGEGTLDDLGYRRMFGGALFESFADHPRKVQVASMGGKVYHSSAAGAYQFIQTTWDRISKQLNLPDFSPKSQDLAALGLINGRKALEDVVNGRFKDALLKCAKEWASLPESPYGQPRITLQQAMECYEKYGGKYDTQDPAPVEEKSMSPLILAGASVLAELLPVAMKAAKAKPNEIEVATKIVGTAKDVVSSMTNTTNPGIEQVIQAVESNKSIKAEVERRLINDKDFNKYLIDKGLEAEKQEQINMDAAAVRRSESVFMLLAVRQFWLTTSVLVMLFALVAWSTYINNGTMPEWATAIIGGAIVGIMMEWRSFTQNVNGTTQGSSAKNAIIERLALK